MSGLEIKRTSISDFDYYLDGIDAVLKYDGAFQVFKRVRGIETIEGVPPSQGAEYRAIALAQTPGILKHLDKFKENDACGSPLTSEYPEGKMSPTTWRYIKVLSDLQTLFSDLDQWDIAEIGPGYGGQYKIIQDVYTPASYTLYDLPPVLDLILKYLNEVGCASLDKVRRADFRRLGEEASRTYDLVISNWAFSECTREVQDIYIRQVLRHARRGYITCNQISHPCGIDSYRKNELLDALGFPVEIMKEGLNLELPADMEQFILYWRNQPLLD